MNDNSAMVPDARVAPHGAPAADVAEALGVDIARGLSADEVSERLRRDGPNSLEVRRVDVWWTILGRQFTSIVVWLLFAAALLAWLSRDHIEAAAIAAVLFINAVIGFWMEWRAARALSALHYEARSTARVRRDGAESLVDAAELVLGDVVVINAGDRVPADVRLVDASSFAADESTFTGESVPVEKSVEPVGFATILADRRSMAYLGTLAVRGHATGLVTGTGAGTELGHIGRLIEKTGSERTPLETRLDALGRRLVYIVLGIALVIATAGIVRGDGAWLMVEMSISLAVAAVPEALPAMTTLILALGVLEMARQHAIVRRLSAVEALGSITVICADKTGTLTENRMAVVEAASPEGHVSTIEMGTVGDLLLTAVLCNEAVSSKIGDPTETALLAAAEAAGVDIDAVRAEYPKRFEEPFDPATKRMVTVHDHNGCSVAFLKGGPSAVLALSSSYRRADGTNVPLDGQRQNIMATNERMATNGLRVLAFAMKQMPAEQEADLLRGFIFLGFLGMTDPPREGVARSLQAAAGAGIRVVMLTGDQLSTARAVARELGLGRNGDVFAMHSRELGDEAALRAAAGAAHVFARVSPEDKLRIVEALQAADEIVAVTGDGINDAPALKRANVGVAMGGRGTEVAKEAADIVLTDDNFTTIVNAIEGGRRIYANIAKFVHLLFSHNLGEVLFIFTAMVAGLPLPLMPLQILWMNLVTDIFPALALAVEPAEPGLMRQQPRRETQLLSKSFVRLVAWQGGVLAASSLAAYLWALSVYGEGPHARMVALFTLVAGQIGQTFNCRSRERSAFSNLHRSGNIFVAVIATILLQITAVYLGPLASVLDLPRPNATDLMIFIACVAVPIAVTEVYKSLRQ